MYKIITKLLIFSTIAQTSPLIYCQGIISDDYLKSSAADDRRTPIKWSLPFPLDAKPIASLNKGNASRYDKNTDQKNIGADQIQSASSQHHTSYHAPPPIKEYHHTSHEHHEHHESTHVKEYPSHTHHEASYHAPPPTLHHTPPPGDYHGGGPILGHMLGHVPYHDHHPVPAVSDVYRSQDTHGNYGFGYETRTVDGDHDYRHEKKVGEVTEGNYGYKTDTAHAHNSFKHVPIHTDPPAVYHGHANHGHVYSVPPISDIPPAASRHFPEHDHGHGDHHSDHSAGHPSQYIPNLMNLGYTDISSDDILARYHSPPPPLYHSEYDMETPYALYSHLLSDIFKSDESIHDLTMPPEPIEPSSASDIYTLTDAIQGIYDNNHINSYLSYLDRVMPSGIHSRLSNPPVYRDRKKRR